MANAIEEHAALGSVGHFCSFPVGSGTVPRCRASLLGPAATRAAGGPLESPWWRSWWSCAKTQCSISASLPLGVQISPVLRHLEPIWEWVKARASSLLLPEYKCVSVCLGSFWEKEIGKIMPPGTGWRNRPCTRDGVRTFQASIVKGFQTSLRPSSMFHPSRPGLTHVSDPLSWGRLNLLWASLWESHQNNPECHRCRCSRSTGTALVQVSCSVWSVLSSIWRSATQLIHL